MTEIEKRLSEHVRSLRDEGGYVYAIGVVGHDRVKIGRSRDPQQRLSHVQVGCPWDVVLVALVRGGTQAEEAIQSALRTAHVRGEWYSVTHEDALALFTACGGGVPEMVREANLASAAERLSAVFGSDEGASA